MTIRQRIANLLRNAADRLGSFTVRVDDSTTKGWSRFSARPNDIDLADMQQLYRDALEATRKNPLAKVIVDITTDFVLGDGIQISATHGRMQAFLTRFWHHDKNRVDLRLQAMSDELARAGDLFILLFRNPVDKMSYMRYVIKEDIVEIETAKNDWETETAYLQRTEDPTRTKRWLSPHHPAAADAEAIMLHYSVNRAIGAGYGEGDLDTVLPWLLKYSRMLEDRVRLHWALRSFLWFVTVPTNQVEAKEAQYATPPEAGSVVVKDNAEEWEVKTPAVQGADARHDLQAVRQMIDAAGYPPHWRNEPGDANLATAAAMQLRPERHLRRRQNYLVFILQDLVYQAFLRSGQPSPRIPFHRLFSSNVSDISRQDNEMLATAANQLSESYEQLFVIASPSKSPTLARLALRMYFKFAGEPQEDQTIDQILEELGPLPDPAEEEENAPGLAANPSPNGHKEKKHA